MKHILPILTAALALTAATASAGTYYDYFESASNKPYTDVADNLNWAGHTYAVNGIITDYGSYQVVRSNYPNQTLQHDSLYTIRITGESVSLYLGDYIDNVGSSTNVDSLMAKGISYVGFRYLDSQNEALIGKEEINPLKAEAVPFESVHFAPNEYYQYDVTRNKYYLGTFSAGDEIEIYLNRTNNLEEGAWSYSTWYKGGYGDGITTTDATDQLMLLYKNGNATEAGLAMPLAALDPNGSRVFFGIIASDPGAVGSPLPGGLQIALIAGLFGLGFWYVRRRKAITA